MCSLPGFCLTLRLSSLPPDSLQLALRSSLLSQQAIELVGLQPSCL